MVEKRRVCVPLHDLQLTAQILRCRGEGRKEMRASEGLAV